MPSRLASRVRQHVAELAARRLAARYFTPAELHGAHVHGRTMRLADATFRVMPSRRGPVLRVTEAPDDPWLRERLLGLPDPARVWEVAAFLKVRRLAGASDVIARARSGDLYDESYFTKRGGGAPYVGYPASVMLDASPWWEEIAAEIVERHRPRRALDVGCATGLVVRALEQRGVAASGIDVSAWAIEHRVTPAAVRGSATDLPWPDETFDLVVSQDFMEHVHPDDLPSVLAEQVRVMRPDAVMVHLIPFYPFDPPMQVDAHLCQATQDWWRRPFAATQGLEIAREPVEDAEGLDGYFELRRSAGQATAARFARDM